MKKYCKMLLIAGIILAAEQAVLSQSGKIALHHLGTVTIYTALNTAITAAVNGDTIYLPGGGINVTTGSVTINKRLAIIGAGHYPDSTIATSRSNITQPIYILTGADGGSLTGVKADDIWFGTAAGNQNINNYTVSRCYINYLYPSYTGQSTSSNIQFLENVIMSISGSGRGFNSVYFEKNIFAPNFAYPYQALLNNNVFHFSGSIFPADNAPCTFNNCILISSVYASITIGQTQTVINNLLPSYTTASLTIGTAGTVNNLLTKETAANTFNGTMTSNFAYTNNYHLKATSNGHNAGTDGTDVGIYGTAYPYKEGAVPFNPHIISKTIGTTTSPTGTLNVDIKVGAQDR